MKPYLTIDLAPRDGTWIQADIPGHGQDNIIAWENGFQDSDGVECGAWNFVTEQEPPDCWTDGVCWELNEYGVKSVQPIHWIRASLKGAAYGKIIF